MASDPASGSAEQGVPGVEAPPSKDARLEAEARFVKRLDTYVEQAQFYGMRGKQHSALEKIPEEIRALPAGSEEQLVALLKWFKESFFRWTDAPLCAACGKKTNEKLGPTEPEEADLRFGAHRVELWSCGSCSATSRFPRFSDPEHLLETRNGRCGEWANCFTLLLSALGFTSRLALDWTDHVWSEVRLGERWTHCDPCENSLDRPLLYEAGWGKKLTYIVAFSPREVVDVSARYTSDWAAMASRRTEATEERVAELITQADEQTRALSGQPMPEWRSAEVAELDQRRDPRAAPTGPSKEELIGRLSGSAEWRAERGEGGCCLPLVWCERQPQPKEEEKEDSSAAPAPGGSFRALVFGATPPGYAKVADGTGTLLGGAALCDLGNTVGIDLTAPTCPAVELPLGPDQDPLSSPASFTLEVVVEVNFSRLSHNAHENPIVSKHGPASGWELRLSRSASAIFLVTLAGHHFELETPVLEKKTKDATSDDRVHIVCTLDGRRMHAQLMRQDSTDPPKSAEMQLPPDGNYSIFSGPALIGRNPAWKDRGAPCRILSFKLSWSGLELQSDP